MKFKKDHVLEALSVGLLLVVISMSTLSPLADDTILPKQSADLGYHTIVVSRMFDALTQGQFPPRLDMSINDHEGYGYPFFQFYSPLTYLLAASLMKLFSLADPYVALKYTIQMAMILGGSLMYLFCNRLVHSKPAALVGACVFITVPYLFINLLVRGAISEAVAQCLTPGVLLTTYLLYRRPSVNTVVFSSVAWSAILLCHLITFLCLAFFVFLLYILIGIINKSSVRRIVWCFVGLPIALCLCAWFIVPIVYYPVQIKDGMGYMGGGTFTTLWTLLAPSPVAPFPLPDPRLNNELLRPAIGLPTMAAFLIMLTHQLNSKANFRVKYLYNTSIALSIVFLIAFFVVWSPMSGFWWKSLPVQLSVIQFTYRILAQLAWIGAVMSAIAAVYLLRRNASITYAFLFAFVSLLCVAPYIYSPAPGGDAKGLASANYNNRDYLYIPSKDKINDLKVANFKDLKCGTYKNTWSCPLDSIQVGEKIVLPILYYPGLQSVSCGGTTLSHLGVYHNGYVFLGLIMRDEKCLQNGLPGEIRVVFDGNNVANSISLFSAFVLLLVSITVVLKKYLKMRVLNLKSNLLSAAILPWVVIICISLALVILRIQGDYLGQTGVRSQSGNSEPMTMRSITRDWMDFEGAFSINLDDIAGLTEPGIVGLGSDMTIRLQWDAENKNKFRFIVDQRECELLKSSVISLSGSEKHFNFQVSIRSMDDKLQILTIKMDSGQVSEWITPRLSKPFHSSVTLQSAGVISTSQAVSIKPLDLKYFENK